MSTPNTPNPDRIVFSAEDYLQRYFIDNVTPKNTAVMDFHAKLYEQIQPSSLLEFGGGPTIYTLLNAAAVVEKIHFADYSLPCLQAIQDWMEGRPNAFDWSPYTAYALQIEQKEEGYKATQAEMEARHDLLRQRIYQISRCDIWEADILLGQSDAPYEALASNFCLEATTGDKKTWLAFTEKLSQLIAKEGYFIISALWDTTQYTHEDVQHNCVQLQPEDITAMYKSLNFTTIYLDKLRTGDGFDYIFACGQKG